MAVYNPMDDMIVGDEADPAYAVREIPTIPTSPKVDEPRTTEQIQKELQDTALTQEYGKFFKPFYEAITPEQELKQQIEQKKLLNQQLLQEAQPIIRNIQQLPQGSLEQLTAIKNLENSLVSKGFEGFNAAEVLGSAGQFLYGDERVAIEKAARGETLTAGEFGLISMAPISSLDFVFPGIAAKLATRGFTKIDDVLKSSLDIPEVRQIKQTFGGSPVPLIQDAAKGPPGMVTEPRIALAKEDGTGGFGTFTDADRAASKAAFNRNTYEPYRNAYNKFIEGKDSVNVGEFREFLKKENVAPTVASGLKDTKKAKDNFNQHLKNALNYLSEGSDVKVRSAAFKPWMTEAENILRENPDGIYPSAISNLLKEKGFVVDGNRIRAWSKGENVEDKSVLDNLKSGSFKQQIQDEKVIEVKKVLDQLEKNPNDRGKGAAKYKFTTPGDGKTYTIQSVLSTKSTGIQKVLGDDVVNKLREYTFKANAPREVFYEYIPAYSKKIFKDSDSTKYNRALDNIFQSFRSGMLGKYNNFEEGMEAYGIQKKTGNKAEDLIINEENKQKILNLNADINKYRRLGGAEKKQYEKIFDDSVELSSYTIPKWKETVLNNPQLRDQVLASWRTIDPNGTLDEAIIAAGKGFSGHVSHIARISGFAGADKEFERGLRGMGALGSMVRVNFGIENLALQRTAENIVDEGVKIMSRLLKKQKTQNLTNKEQDTLFRIASNIGYYNNLMKTKGMAAYLRIPKETLTDDVMNYLNNYFKARGGPNLTPSDQVVAKTIKPSKEDNIAEKYNDIFIGTETPQTLDQQKARFDELLDFYVNNPKEFSFSKQSPKFSQDIVEGFGETPYIRFAYPNTAKPIIERETNFKKGGAVRMAIGGDPLQNINQQQFTPDPAIDDDFFKQAVESGNLQAFGAGNLFKFFGKVPGLLTPNKVVSDVPTGTGAAPMVPNVDPGDFPFKSYFIESTTSPNAPKSALPKDWLKYYTGNIAVPQSEMKDAGIFNYLEDIEKFFPNTKLTQQNLIDVYESSPIANIEVKVKREPIDADAPPGPLGTYMGKPKHKGTGSQPLDNVGENYREIVVNVDKLPGQETQFFNASHFAKDPNVIAFTRVADYKDVDGNTVAVIQEMQTDMLTNLKKEQERMKATAEMVRNYKAKLKEQIANGETYQQDLLDRFEREYPESMLQFMETSDLVRPNDPTFASQLTPDVVKELTEIQERITTIANQNRERVVDPDFQNKIVALQEEGRQKFNALFELNRGTNYQDQLKNIRVLDVDNTEDLANYVNRNPSYMGSNEFRPVQSFPVLPFNKGKDYIDLLLKATIKDAEANGINKVAIFPSELVNRRWGKDPDGPAGKKFKTIYDNITVQELKNIAKKYTGSKNNLKIEEIVDPSKADKGIKFLNKGVDGEFQLLRDVEPRGDGNAPGNIQAFLDTEIERVASDYGPNEVVLRREIAPDQTMEYFVKTKADGFDLVPLGDGDRAENATIIIEEYNPQIVKMYTLTLPEETTKKGPMFIYGKKDGGKIASDGLVSITDIFGEY